MDGQWVQGDEWWYEPTVTLHADNSDITISSGAGEIGSYDPTTGRPLYREVIVTAYNSSWIHSYNMSFTWTCDPNPS